MAKAKGSEKKVVQSALVAPNSMTALLTEDFEARRQAAIELDKKIDSAIERLGREVAKAYVAIGKDLMEMKATEGYQLLGCLKWAEYLRSKENRLKKTYSYYVMRLAQAEGLDNYFEVLSGAQFIEYSKLVTGDKIPLLMADTAEQVKGLSARATAKTLEDYIKKHPGKYRRVIEGRKAPGGRAPAAWQDKFRKQYEAAKDKDAFVKGMEEYLNSLRPSKK